MIIRTAKFMMSVVSKQHYPKQFHPEFAFIGRSNVGKSSLINMLTTHKLLAKISSTPGKTRTLNYFSINEEWYLVDMPGYGYARTSKKQRETFKDLISEYFKTRTSLVCAFVLIDSRHAPLVPDIEFITMLGEMQIPFALVFTKIDKLSKIQLEKNLNIYTAEVLKYFDEMPTAFLASSINGNGRKEILDFIEQSIKDCKEAIYKLNHFM